jgi:hypothetical protein
MRFKSGLRAAAIATALIPPSGLSLAIAGGFGGGGFGGAAPTAPSFARPTIGVGAYAPGEGPVGAAGWYGGSWNGYAPARGRFWGGGYYGGGGNGGGETIASGGSANVFTYNHYDQRRRDGGFYGGNGVFYGDDGYSRAPLPERPADSFRAGPYDDPHIIYLPTSSRAARVTARRAASK